jgi:spore coat protein A
VTYDYPNWQQPATIWYHDHALGITRLNVYMGLAGFYLIRDAAEAALGLPTGLHEVPLVIQDRRFAPDGSLSYPAVWQEHFFGDVVLVNGKVWPYLEVDRGKYRFRMLNGSNARVYRLALSNGAAFFVIGADGGLLEAPRSVTSLTLAPGERADVVIDFAAYAAGTRLVLRNDAPAPFPGDPGVGVVPDIMQFRVVAQTGHTAALPLALTTIAPLPESAAVANRELLLEKTADPCTGSAWTINRLHWNDLTEAPQLGTSEIWTFINNSGVVHPMHMHLVFFQVLDRQSYQMIGGVPTPTGSRPLAAHETGWKDTVQVGPGEMVRVIARFEDFVGKFPYHCHILEHEDHEMMRQFQTETTCGDGARGLPDEECDDGNNAPGDGCSATCTIEAAPVDGGMPDAGVLDAGPDARTPDAGFIVDASALDAPPPLDAGPDNDEDTGCGCDGTGPGTGPGSLALLLLSWPALRRRRHR